MLWLTNLKNNAVLLAGAALGFLLLLLGIQREKNKRLEAENKHKESALKQSEQTLATVHKNAEQRVETQQSINQAHKKAAERENAKASKTRVRPVDGDFSGGVPDDK
ncbi:hypothetical protein Kuja_1600 [Vibrio phage vB_VchM_Kuja]|uniref:DUF2681 domain-containing protein n=1 Tax=Vibrio phage vB_VchM_Kuja TaxID=2686437 RepID=A0A6B9J5H7_9CAUD|nr:hypothetical protein HWC83_gp076 [Vibrio phage vB_VchM_Kuja]QGZ16151.1 hypothetical protein Kuja_1600 [Vibrio phage vB_VchM_Kuja]